jgi:hypothetical protein
MKIPLPERKRVIRARHRWIEEQRRIETDNLEVRIRKRNKRPSERKNPVISEQKIITVDGFRGYSKVTARNDGSVTLTEVWRAEAI